MDFPRLVYKGPATHVLVQNAAEHEQALKAGWHDSVPAALGHKPAPVAPAPQPEQLTETPPAAVASGKKSKKGGAEPVAPIAVAVAPQKQPWD